MEDKGDGIYWTKFRVKKWSQMAVSCPYWSFHISAHLPKNDFATACRAWGGQGMNQSMPVLFTSPWKERQMKKTISLQPKDAQGHGHYLQYPTHWWTSWICLRIIHQKQGFSSSVLLPFGPDTPPFLGLSEPYGMFSSTPGLYELDISSILSTPPTWQPKMSPGIDKCPLRGITPQCRTTILEMGAGLSQKADRIFWNESVEGYAFTPVLTPGPTPGTCEHFVSEGHHAPLVTLEPAGSCERAE